MTEYIPVLSLIVAALAIFVGPIIGYVANKRQIASAQNIANKQVIAPMRQEWINDVREIVSEIVSTAHWWYVANDSGDLGSFESARNAEEEFDRQFARTELRLIQLSRKLELMLNPKESDHNELVELVDIVVKSAFGAKEIPFGPNEVGAAMSKCKEVLKREWEVVKSGG